MPQDEEGLFSRILGRRYERASLVLTPNRNFLDRSEIFGDQVLAPAILDRLLHHATTSNQGRTLPTQGQAQGRSTNPDPEIRGASDRRLRIEDTLNRRKGDKLNQRWHWVR